MRRVKWAIVRSTIVALLAVPLVGAAQMIRADHDRLLVAQMAQYDHPSAQYQRWLARLGRTS